MLFLATFPILYIWEATAAFLDTFSSPLCLGSSSCFFCQLSSPLSFANEEIVQLFRQTCSMMSNTTTYRRHPCRVSLNIFNLFICSLCLDMLTVFIYAHCFYICSLFLYMLTVFIYVHCVQICPLFLDMPKLVFLQWQDEKGVRNDPHKDDNLLELVSDLCNFIMDQIINVGGIYHDRATE